MSETAERVLADVVVRITGLPLRTVQDLAKRGRIPGAAKLGSRWTFDLAKLRRWVRAGEEEACREISIGAGKRGGRESRFKGGSSDEAYERLLR